MTVDLHWSSRSRAYRGFLSSGGKQSVPLPGGTLTYTLPVPAREDMGSVRAVIYISPTGGWRNRVKAAISLVIPVAPGDQAPHRSPQIRAIALHEQVDDPAADRRDVVPVNILIAAVWGTGAWFWWRTRMKPGFDRARRELAPQNTGTITATLCVLAGIWVLLPAERMVGGFARALAVDHHWYDGRLGFQLTLMSVIVMGAAGCVTLIIQRVSDWPRRCAWLGLGGFAGSSLASLLSLHEIDTLLARTFLAVPLLQVLQLGTAALTLAGTALATRAGRHVPAVNLPSGYDPFKDV